MKKSHNETTPKIVGGFVLTGVALIAFYTLMLYPNGEEVSGVASTSTTQQQATAATSATPSSAVTANAASSSPSNSTNNAATTTDNATNSYKDGTYKATKSYNVPHGGVNSITVEIAVSDGTVTSVNVEDSYGDRESASYVSSFESRVSAAVKGKKLSSLSVGRIGGASLTSSAFKQALSSIVAEAKA